MLNIHSKKDCCGCSACANACPKSCIAMKADDEGFLYPVINTDDCTDCNICVRSCPEINYESPHTKTSVYGCYNKDEDVRLQSSSGGIFYLLCKYVIEKGGVVFGAADRIIADSGIALQRHARLHRGGGSFIFGNSVPNRRTLFIFEEKL